MFYVDPEMGRLEVRERLEALDLTPDELKRLHYSDLVPKINNPDGAAAFNRTMDRLGIEIIAIDGMNGIVDGAEKDDTTWRPLFDLVIAPNKAKGRAIITGENTGKDVTLNDRGSSIKLDKPDAVLVLSRTSEGIKLKATHRRSAVYPHEQFYTIHGTDGSEPIHYRRAKTAWPANTRKVSDVLDLLGVPDDISRRDARAALKAAREIAKDDPNDDPANYQTDDVTLQSSLRWRKAGRPGKT